MGRTYYFRCLRGRLAMIKDKEIQGEKMKMPRPLSGPGLICDRFFTKDSYKQERFPYN